MFDDVWYYIRDVAHVLSDDPTETVCLCLSLSLGGLPVSTCLWL